MESFRRIGALTYGAICYVIFFVTFLYLVGFVGNFGVPKTIDSGVPGNAAWAIVVDTVLLLVFGLQHSVMARPGWKRAIQSVIPHSIERSTYVLESSAALVLLYWLWQPLPQQIWAFESGFGFWALTGLYLAGYGLILYSTFLIDHFDLFGLRQVYLRARGRTDVAKRFMTPGLYKLIRHPLYVGWMITFWAAPVFTVGHLLFASVLTAYIVVAIRYEERDLAAQLGEPYVRWRSRTPAFVPGLGAGQHSPGRGLAEETR